MDRPWTLHRGSPHAMVAVVLMSATIMLSGCDEVTHWDARGSWSGRLTLPGEETVPGEESVDAGDSARPQDRIRLCELDSATFGLPFTGAVRDKPAALRIRTPDALCRTGRRSIGGTVLVWSPVGQDTLTLSAMPSAAWEVSGEIDVVEYRESGLPDLDVGESATIEALSGTLTITATDGSGSTIGLEEATFDLRVTARRVELSIS